MTWDLQREIEAERDADEAWANRPAPGKVTRTASMKPPRTPAVAPSDFDSEVVQADGAVAMEDPFAIHLAAQRGVAGAASALPHLDAIQQSFGHHDVSGIRAHVGGAAREAAQEIGARAYATGDAVAFGSSPDLRLAAHEAAHVVQQRGGVRLDGGVGRAGDPYELHADAVAERVVRGDSAEALLDTMAHRGASGGAAVQRDNNFHFTDPIPFADGDATETIDRAGLASATLDQLIAAYAMAAPADPAAPIALGAARVQYTWIRGRVGTVVLRGEIRSRLIAEGAAAVAGREPAIAALTGDAERIAEVRAMVAEARSGRGALVDESEGEAHWQPRSNGTPHHASDITSRAGTGVYAPIDGEVIFSGGVSGYGNMVRLLHRAPPTTTPEYGTGAVESVYCHLSERLVAMGERVARGQAIGMVGQSFGDEDPDHDGEGYAGRVGPIGAHLHMAVIRRPDIPAVRDESAPRERHRGHSTGAEVSADIHPNQWLGALGVDVTADEIFRMDAPEARDARADARTSGGAREVRREPVPPGTRGTAGSAPVPAVSPRTIGAAAATGDDGVEIAQRGLESATDRLPFAEPLQRAFGHHRLDDVGVQVGGAAATSAAALGAAAYASDGRIGFAQAPSLELAAHEAAHVIQQRHGQVPAGVSTADHPSEAHADAVAAAVVRGESAEALLDGGGGGGGATAAVQRFEEVPGTDTSLELPPGVTAAQVAAAITYDNGREFRIDWVRRLQSHLRADGTRMSIDGNFDNDTVVGLMRFQATAGITVDGRLTPQVRRMLEAVYPDLRSTLVGPHLEADRVLVPGAASTAERYGYYRDIITGAAGVFLDQPREINLLAIRGVAITGDAPSLELRQTGSAAEFAAARTADDAALADGSAAGDTLHADANPPPRHFSGRAGYDDVVISIWFERTGDTTVHHVTERRGSVDPASVWSASDANDRPTTEGTSHLRDGQYVYRLGMHNTSADGHRDAVNDAYGGDHAGGPVHVNDGADSTSYTALVPARDIEVWRDRPGSSADDHYLTAAEEEASNAEIVDHDDRYVHAEEIDINIHSSPTSGPSSLGCQAVPTDAGYDAMIGEVAASANPQAVYYTLIDASRIEAGLVVEQSGAQAGAPAASASQAPVMPDGGATTLTDPAAIHAAAAAGVGGAGGALPHLDAIQQSFGHHDVSGVSAHVGGAAAAAARTIGAGAYATGNAVAFAASPDLRQAAHEAAHVVQQRGGVRLDGGVGRAGDAYELHADAVAERVVRGDSAEALLDTMAHRGARGGEAVQRDANRIAIHDTWRADTPAAAEERASLASHLADVLRHPVEPTAAGVEAAIREFQLARAEDIETVRDDSTAMFRTFDGPRDGFGEARPPSPPRDATPEARAAARTALREWGRRRAAWLRRRTATTADDGARSTAGELRPNDATHIALANAWPRRFFGVLLETAADGYDYLKSQVTARGLPFDDDRVNIVGVRGMQGGEAHTDVGVGLAASTFDDSFFVLCLDDGGGKVIREFRGTTEPGGRSTEHRTQHPETYPASERSASVRDRDVETMETDQQVVYHFTTVDTSKLGRPTLTPRVEAADGTGLVVAPHRTGDATVTEDDSDHDGDPAAVASTVTATDPRRRDRLRTRRGAERLDRSGGIAIHSGDANDTVDAESTGCQVIQGDWYGDFTATIQRGLTAARARHGGGGRGPATEGDVLYSLLDGANLARGDAAMRAAIAGARAPTQPAADVHGDGGLDGDAATVQAHAQAGVVDAAAALPHHAAIQASFGHHDVSGIRAHVGGAAAEAAAAIGARAYATGDDVAFAAAPDLRLAAHEAAHVVQQRGGVRLDGGVGRAGDPYEQHADAVAERVVRGDSAEALLDTMAHRGAGGGAAVQRAPDQTTYFDPSRDPRSPDSLGYEADPPPRPELGAYIDRSERPNELIAAEYALGQPIDIGTPRHPRQGARFRLDGHEFTVEQAEFATCRDRLRARLDARAAGGEWQPPARPTVGQTWMGVAFVEDSGSMYLDVDGVRLRAGQFPRESGHYPGFVCRDTTGALDRMRSVVAAEYETANEPYRAAATHGIEVLGEGGAAALNTYDDKILTIGAGFANERLDSFLQRLAGTPAGAALGSARYLGGLHFNRDRAAMLDVHALAAIVNAIVAHADAVARAQIQELVEGSARAPRPGTAAATRADAAAAATDPAVVGIATYLCHGRNAFTPDPAADVVTAVAAFPADQSCQVAMLLRLHAERILGWKTSSNPRFRDGYAEEAREAATRRLPAKIAHFTDLMHEHEPGFTFDFGAARSRVMGCIAPGAAWPGTTTAPTAAHLDAEVDGVMTYWKITPG